MATQATTRKIERDREAAQKATKLLETVLLKALDDSQGGAIQLGWAKLYLAKTMPDLKAIDHSGDVEFVGQHFIFKKPD